MTNFEHIDLKDDSKWAEILELAERMPTPHKPDRRLHTIIISNPKTGEKLGYVQVVQLPLVVTSWVRPGKDTINAVKDAKEYFEKACGGTLMTGCPLDSKFYPHMERLGFTPSNLAVFYSVSET